MRLDSSQVVGPEEFDEADPSVSPSWLIRKIDKRIDWSDRIKV